MTSRELEKAINETPVNQKVRVNIPGIVNTYDGTFVWSNDGLIHIIDDRDRKVVIPKEMITNWEKL